MRFNKKYYILVLGDSASGTTELRTLLAKAKHLAEYTATGQPSDPVKSKTGSFLLWGNDEITDFPGSKDRRHGCYQKLGQLFSQVVQEEQDCKVHVMYCINAMNLFCLESRRDVQTRCRADIDLINRSISWALSEVEKRQKDLEAAREVVKGNMVMHLIVTHYDEWLYHNNLAEKKQNDVWDSLGKIVCGYSQMNPYDVKLDDEIKLVDLLDSKLTQTQKDDLTQEAIEKLQPKVIRCMAM